MAGVVTQSANLVRQKAYNAVYGTGTGTSTDSVSPYFFYAVKALFLHLAINKGNPDLQFIPYTAAQDITAAGYLPLGAGACTLYAWFTKATRTSLTTKAYDTIRDATDNTTTDATIATQMTNLAGQQAIMVWPNGFPVATELVITSTTAVDGQTETTTAALASNGFVIVGA
jgi:hypothetical protein